MGISFFWGGALVKMVGHFLLVADVFVVAHLSVGWRVVIGRRYWLMAL